MYAQRPPRPMASGRSSRVEMLEERCLLSIAPVFTNQQLLADQAPSTLSSVISNLRATSGTTGMAPATMQAAVPAASPAPVLGIYCQIAKSQVFNHALAQRRHVGLLE